MDSDKLIEETARALVASDFAKAGLGELTDLRWNDMLQSWRSLEDEPELRSGYRVDDALRRARVAVVAFLRARADQVEALRAHGVEALRAHDVQQLRLDADRIEEEMS